MESSPVASLPKNPDDHKNTGNTVNTAQGDSPELPKDLEELRNLNPVKVFPVLSKALKLSEMDTVLQNLNQEIIGNITERVEVIEFTNQNILQTMDCCFGLEFEAIEDAIVEL